MPRLDVEVYQSLLDALTTRCNETSESVRHFVSRVLSDALGLDHSTLFQVSTTGALVQGVYKGAVTVGELRKHGDFGLGTFEGLDGEMVVVDGRFYQVQSDGRITEPPDAAPVPFAVVTTFRPNTRSGTWAHGTAIGAIDPARYTSRLGCVGGRRAFREDEQDRHQNLEINGPPRYWERQSERCSIEKGCDQTA